MRASSGFQRGQDGGEREPAQSLEVGRGSFVAVAGEPHGADQPLLLGPYRSLERTVVGEHQVELVDVADGVQLEQVDVVGLQPLERPVDRRPGGVVAAVAGLGREEDPVADGGHDRAEPQLGLAIAGRDVEVVDAGVEGQLDRLVGGVLGDLTEGRGPVDDDRTLVAETAQSAIAHTR